MTKPEAPQTHPTPPEDNPRIDTQELIPPEELSLQHENDLQGPSQSGLRWLVRRFGVRAIMILLLGILVWSAGNLLMNVSGNWQESATPSPEVTTPEPLQAAAVPLPPFTLDRAVSGGGITRSVQLHTIFPTRPRYTITKYTVAQGDTLWDIGIKFNLKTETILWGNVLILQDNPHLLQPGMVLNILPVDGVYHQWSEGEGLNGVSNGYGVKPEDIINYPGNHLTLESVGDFSNPNIAPGTWLIIPNGRREFSSWATPSITRKNPSAAKYLGAGFCPDAMTGVTGSGTFVFPTVTRTLRGGYDYSPEIGHFAIDLPGSTGDPIFASDTGVVVYAGWSNLGYGNIIVLDHGNGWLTYYAHLSAIYVDCGQGIFQGATMGALGSTGNSSGPHLHFEMRSSTYGRANPWNFLR